MSKQWPTITTETGKSMITIEEYAGVWATSEDWTTERMDNAQFKLLPRVWELTKIARLDQVIFRRSPVTWCEISGQTLGGFRPQNCHIGAMTSNHKEGLAVDIYDPDGEIDAWCSRNLHYLKTCGIWIESPAATKGWSHWQCVPPKSGYRIFTP